MSTQLVTPPLSLSVSELTGGATSEWNSLFNGQLDGLDSLDPMSGVLTANPDPPPPPLLQPQVSSHATPPSPCVDRSGHLLL